MSTPAKATSPKAKTGAKREAPVQPVTTLPTTDALENTGPRPVIIGPVMRKKELIDAVVERSGVKKKDAKPVVEAMMEVLGEALADHRELNLLPMGKFKVINEKDLKNGKMIRVKVRQLSQPNGAGETQYNTTEDTFDD